MSYYFSKIIKGTFNQVLERITATLKKEGFGVLTRRNSMWIFKTT
jgi:uncharacterized protein (DUF302 family)